MKISSQGQEEDGSKPTDRNRLQDHMAKAKAKERGRATSRGRNDASRDGEDQQPTLAFPFVGSNVKNTLFHNQSVTKGQQFLAVRDKIRAWEALGADVDLLAAIQHGI